MSVQVSDSIFLGTGRPLDYKYANFSGSGFSIPWATTASACSGISASNRHIGLTVLIGTSSTQPYPQEYWWQNGTSDSQLVLKQSGGGVGNITGSASLGYVTLWTGTTSIGYDSSISWNKGNPFGLLIGTNSYTSLSGSYSLQVSNDTYIGGKIFVASSLSGNNGLSASAISTNGGIYAQNFIEGAGGIGIFNGFQNGFFRSNTIQTTAFGTSSITGLSIYTSGTYSNLGLTANNIGIVVNPQISGSGFFSNTIGVQIIPINNISTYTSNWSSLLIGGTIPSGTWSIYNSDPSSNYFAGNLSIGTSFFYGTYSLQVNGNAYIQGNAKITGYIQMPSNTVPTTGTSSLQLYALQSSALTYDTLTYTGRDGITFNIGNSVFITVLNYGSYSLPPNTVISMDSSGRIVRASPDKYQNQLLGITVDTIPIGGYGRYVAMGVFRNINTWNYGLGTKLYIDYNGGLTSSLPIGYPAQCIGVVGNIGTGTFSNDGSLLINPSGALSPNWSNNINDIFNNNTGNVLIGFTQSQGSAILQVSGNAYFSGNISASGSITAQTGGFDSDLRLKSNIVYNPVIEGIDSIKSASYVIGGNSHIGYIAQDVEDIVPSSIIKKEDGYLALNYNEVLVAKVAYLENKVKELYDIIERNGLK